jgi:hypothetical protein
MLLVKRMRSTGLRELRWVFLTFLFAAIAAILGLAWTGFRILLNPPVAIFILPFVKETFFRKKRSIFKKLLVVSLCLFILSSSLRILNEYLGDYPVADIIYLSYLGMILAIFIICYGWFFIECIRMSRILTDRIEPWVKTRYKLLALSCALAISTAVFPMFYPNRETFHEQALLKIVMAASNVCFSATSFIAWFLPNRLIRGVTRNKLPVTTEIVQEPSNQKLGTSVVIAIIDYLGNKLAPLIGKSPEAAKGLLLLSVEAAEKSVKSLSPDFKTLHDAIVVDLKNRLEQLGTDEVQHIIDVLTKELVDYQSLFVMLSLG